ncbi:MAG TPA: pyridoxal-phosphate dependent enzyme [Nannocystaceae bacterium]|nr:pyridoxal-phosphate dependent enzyme [Nannocystaceae bacterium]
MIAIEEIRAARERIAGIAVRTPLVRLPVDGEVWVKLECLQPIGSFKLRGAANAFPDGGGAVYTASAGNMAQGVGWVARARGSQWSAVVPDHAPQTKLAAIERLGGEIVKLPFDAWWKVIVEHRHSGLAGHFIHPVADRAVMAGNGTIALEILEDLPDVDTIVVPYGGGGLVSGIASAVKAIAPRVRVIACEAETAAPLCAALAAGAPTPVEYIASFVDGIGSRAVLDEMWPLVRSLVDGAVAVSLAEIAAAIRTLVERAHVVAEGAGACAVAAALAGKAGAGKVACIVSGGNLDPSKLAKILAGELP